MRVSARVSACTGIVLFMATLVLLLSRHGPSHALRVSSLALLFERGPPPANAAHDRVAPGQPALLLVPGLFLIAEDERDVAKRRLSPSPVPSPASEEPEGEDDGKGEEEDGDEEEEPEVVPAARGRGSGCSGGRLSRHRSRCLSRVEAGGWRAGCLCGSHGCARNHGSLSAKLWQRWQRRGSEVEEKVYSRR